MFYFRAGCRISVLDLSVTRSQTTELVFREKLLKVLQFVWTSCVDNNNSSRIFHMASIVTPCFFMNSKHSYRNSANTNMSDFSPQPITLPTPFRSPSNSHISRNSYKSCKYFLHSHVLFIKVEGWRYDDNISSHYSNKNQDIPREPFVLGKIVWGFLNTPLVGFIKCHCHSHFLPLVFLVKYALPTLRGMKLLLLFMERMENKE